MDLKQALQPVLGEKAALVKKSFDVIGTVAILEIPDGLVRQQAIIAHTLQELNPHITTVCKKSGERSGPYRLRIIRKISGNGTETIHREHGCRFLLDVRKTYFSPRESTERQRIASLVKPKETVMVFFAGIGPYCIVIAKHQPATHITGIESNAAAIKYFKENIRVNRCSLQVVPLLGDVATASIPFAGSCDRVVMPLPTLGYTYLPQAFRCLRKGGTLHFYGVGERTNPFRIPLQQLRTAAKKEKRKIHVNQETEVLPFGPGKTKVCIDAIVT